MDLSSTLLSGAAVLLSLLLAGNLFFIKRLIVTIEKSRDLSVRAQASSGHVSEALKEIKKDLKSFRKVETDVAILKSMAYRSRRKGKGADSS